MVSRVGAVGVFTEDDLRLRVRVLHDDSDEKWERYTFEIIEVLQDSRIYKGRPAPGDRFPVSLKRGVAFGGMWHFQEEEEQ